MTKAAFQGVSGRPLRGPNFFDLSKATDVIYKNLYGFLS
jgi:hypothetical protein